MFVGTFGMLFITPIVWIITGDKDRAFGWSFEAAVPSFLINLPYKIMSKF